MRAAQSNHLFVGMVKAGVALLRRRHSPNRIAYVVRDQQSAGLVDSHADRATARLTLSLKKPVTTSSAFDDRRRCHFARKLECCSELLSPPPNADIQQCAVPAADQAFRPVMIDGPARNGTERFDWTKV